MSKITNHKQAETLAKKLVPFNARNEVKVATEPIVHDSKSFWPVEYLDKQTKKPVIVRGSKAYITDNGKLITLSSNPLVDPTENEEKQLLSKYDQ
ncbi:hypothetical protein IPL68_01350 [Candidatus Saccharibacteria bacterium]|nr:MAG: hypothetical protein IPL68_01350 [Candidatus Saccharibacteria bacterium]